MKYKNTSKI